MKKIFSLLVGALLVYSCTPEVELGTPFQAGQKVSLTAHMPNTNGGANQLPGKQRVSGVDAGTHINLTWDAGDVVLVTVDGHTAEFTLESGAGSATGTFTGTMPSSGTTYSVQYPVSEPDLSNQTYVENGFGKGLLKLTATNGTIDGGFTLSAQNSIFGLQLKGNTTVRKIVLTNLENSEVYSLNYNFGVTLTSTAQLFYFVIPAGEWESGLKVEVYASEDTKLAEFSTSNSITMSPDKATIMPEKEVIVEIEFSVSETKKVIFSPGNLQYHPKNNMWRFAEHQYDYIGDANANISATYNGWIDLFGWSGSNGTAKFGVSASEDPNDYSGDFVDWGTNVIGSDAPNTWRTLTTNEWMYLANVDPFGTLQVRAKADKLMGVAQVNGVNGIVLLPDVWACPCGMTFKSGFNANTDFTDNYYADYQKFTAEEWEKLEWAGAVFLPAAGFRTGVIVKAMHVEGFYWGLAMEPLKGPGSFSVSWLEVWVEDGGSMPYYGQLVRLIKEL